LFADGDARAAHVLQVLRAQPPEVPLLDALQAAVLDVANDYESQRGAVLLRHRIVAATPSLRSHAAERHHGWESALLEELRPSARAGTMSEATLRLTVAAAVTALRVAVDIWIEGGGECDLPGLLAAALDQLRSGLDG
jgi:hypothetical protein